MLPSASSNTLSIVTDEVSLVELVIFLECVGLCLPHTIILVPIFEVTLCHIRTKRLMRK